MINPDLLRTFLALAETKHFTRTAETLHMTQPGVSQHIQRLEAYFGTALLNRHGKTFSLTEAGKKLVEYGRKSFSDHARLKEALAKDDPFIGVCRLASPGSFGFKLFDALLACAKKYPELRVELTVAPNRSIVTLLIEERIDVGFVTQDPDDPSLQAEVFEKERLMLVVPKSFGRVRTLKSLCELGFINHPDGFHHAGRLLQLNFPREFVGMDRIPIRVFINQINRILDPVAMGLGFTVLPEFACNKYFRREEVHFVRLPKAVEDPIYLVTRKGDRLPARFHTIRSAL